MIYYIIDTRVRRELVTIEELEPYYRAKSLFAEAVEKGIIGERAVEYIRKRMHITKKLAGHYLALNVKELDSIEL